MRPRHTLAATALVSVLTLAAGCSDDTTPSSQDPTSPPTTSTTTDSTTTATPTDPGAADPSSTVAPATGVLLSLRHAEVRTPEGWTLASGRDRQSMSAGQTDGTGFMHLADRPFDNPGTLAQLREASVNTQDLNRPPTPRPNTTLDGVEVYHLAGVTDGGRWVEELGAPYEDAIVRVIIELDADLSPAERRETVASILATFRWK